MTTQELKEKLQFILQNMNKADQLTEVTNRIIELQTELTTDLNEKERLVEQNTTLQTTVEELQESNYELFKQIPIRTNNTNKIKESKQQETLVDEEEETALSPEELALQF